MVRGLNGYVSGEYSQMMPKEDFQPDYVSLLESLKGNMAKTGTLRLYQKYNL